MAEGAVAGSRQKWSEMAVGRPLVPLWCAHRTVVQVVEPDLTEFESLEDVTARRSSACATLLSSETERDLGDLGLTRCGAQEIASSSS